jgi:hypothetical protein
MPKFTVETRPNPPPLPPIVDVKQSVPIPVTEPITGALQPGQALLNTKQIAALLQLSPRKIRYLAKAKIIPSIRIGWNLRFDPVAVWAEIKRLESQRPRTQP